MNRVDVTQKITQILIPNEYNMNITSIGNVAIIVDRDLDKVIFDVRNIVFLSTDKDRDDNYDS